MPINVQILARENDKSGETQKRATPYVLHSTVLDAACFRDSSSEKAIKPGKTSLIARERCRIGTISQAHPKSWRPGFMHTSLADHPAFDNPRVIVAGLES